ADPNDGLQIWDVTNATSSVPPTRYDTSPLNIQQGATAGSSCVGNLLYVAQRSNRALQIVGPSVPVPFDYTFSTPPTNVTLAQGGSSQNTSFTITRTSGTSQPVSFTNSPLPSGVTASYSATSCTPTCTTVLTLSASPSAATGTNTITISGNSPVHNVTFNLTVNNIFDYSLSNNTVGGNITIPGGNSGNVIVTRTLTSGTTTLVTLSVSGLPAHTSVTSISNNPCGPTCSSTINIKVNPPTTPGTYPISVT